MILIITINDWAQIATNIQMLWHTSSHILQSILEDCEWVSKECSLDTNKTQSLVRTTAIFKNFTK